MKKKKPIAQGHLIDPELLSPRSALHRRRSLILPRFLSRDAADKRLEGERFDEAHRIICRWADLAEKGALRRKETSLDAEFLREVFGSALGFRLQTEYPNGFNLERNFTVSGVGTADGALGYFAADTPARPVAVIELKDSETDLDVKKFNGRTPVQQCWDYLNALPDTPWGIVSNFVTFRLYHRDRTPLAFEYFKLSDLRDRDHFKRFWVLFESAGLLTSSLGQPPRALRLLTESGERQRDVGDELYKSYSKNRLGLIDHLHTRVGRPIDAAIAAAQKLLDRIIFVAFCEDRGLLPQKLIERTYSQLPPLAKVTNPRWQNFLNLFVAVDRGHPDLVLENGGYNGGLFRHDPAVDDLQLPDEWTLFFREVGQYDFRDEVNVDVLGHLFEKSITEIERLRHAGFFEAVEDASGAPATMPKSAQRKRLGIYYTPPEFTHFIVQQTVGAIIRARFAALADRYGVNVDSEDDSAAGDAAEYWNACWDELRQIKVCDPACGSGAFLIQAYDLLEDRYSEVVQGLLAAGVPDAAARRESVPDVILADNLYGVDLSQEAVEITQLALWIRSARRGKTLSDLSQNIVWGNSLVTDASVDPRAMDWRSTFAAVFNRPEPGFDCVIGNPPWERLKLQEREFFSLSAPEIAASVSAADRRRLIARLERSKPKLYRKYQEARARADSTLAHVRDADRFPLAGRGDVNTYALFVELARSIVAPHGRVGLLTPSSIATDNTTRELFDAIVSSNALVCLYDFENKDGLFPDVHRSFKFCVLVFNGSQQTIESARFVFFARRIEDLADRSRHIRLTAQDFRVLNPNTGTCPVFRSARDAEITKAIYRRVPILVEDSRGERGNPWGVQFLRMFDQTNDAELFVTSDELKRKRFRLEGNRWTKGKTTYLPLYEAKMVRMYDHRAASVVVEEGNWMRQGQTSPTSLVAHQQPEYVVQPRWWVADSEVETRLNSPLRPAYIAYKDVTSPTNERTMIAAFIPHVGVVNSAPLVLTDPRIDVRRACCLLANLNSLLLDYVARQKVGNIHLNYFVVRQLPVYAPDAYGDRCPWDKHSTLEKWISERVLKLTCTADDMVPLAEAAGFKQRIHKWREDERRRLMAELDAAYFRLYGISRDDAEYVLSTFTGTQRQDEAETGRFMTAELVHDAYDALAEAT